MKNITVVFFAGLLVTGVSAKHISEPSQTRLAKPAPQVHQAQPESPDSINFDKLVYDYGTIELGGDGVSVFTFTNPGQKPLVLSNVRASCGCTVPEWPREPIAPGEKGEIKVKYNTNINGSFNKTITVNSNAANSTVILRIKGNVVQGK